MQFPLAQLELTRTAKRRSTYGLRLAIPLFSAAVLIIAWLIMSSEPLVDVANFSSRFLSWTVLLFQFFVACALTPVFASGAIATEKQERTLGLLLLADIRGGDVLLSKGLAVFLQAEMLILSCLPLQAIAALFGGPTLTMFVGQQIAAMALCFATSCLGLLCSTLCARALDALAMTLGIELLWIMSCMFLDALLLEPAGLGRSCGIPVLADTITPNFSMGDVLSFSFYAALFGLACFAIAWLRLPSLTEEKPASRRSERRGRTFPGLLDCVWFVRLDPVGNLYAANAAGVGGAIFRWPWNLLIFLTMFCVGLPLSPVFWVAVAVLVVYDVTSSLSTTRANGGLDLLLITDADDREITRAIYRTHLQRALIFAPGLFSAHAIYSFMPWAMRDSFDLISSGAFLAVALAFALVLTAVDLTAYVCLGCAATTWSRRPGMQTLLAMLALFGVHLLISCGGSAASMFWLNLDSVGTLGVWPSLLMALSTSAVRVVLLIAFAVSWRSSLRTAIRSPRWLEAMRTT